MKVHEVFEYLEGVVIIIPYFPRGSLAGLKLGPTELKDAVRQILETLHHLHEVGYIMVTSNPATFQYRTWKGNALTLFLLITA